jgi:catalase
MFAYPDAQRYRLGVNYTQLPSNRPLVPVYAPFDRDGITATKNYGGDPNYVRSTLSPGRPSQAVTQIRHTERISASASLGLNAISVDETDFVQPRILWTKVFDDKEREAWVANVADSLRDVPGPLSRAVAEMFGRVDSGIAVMILGTLNQDSAHL